MDQFCQANFEIALYIIKIFLRNKDLEALPINKYRKYIHWKILLN